MCKHMAMSNSVSRSLRILRTEMDSLFKLLDVFLLQRYTSQTRRKGEIGVLKLDFSH